MLNRLRPGLPRSFEVGPAPVVLSAEKTVSRALVGARSEGLSQFLHPGFRGTHGRVDPGVVLSVESEDGGLDRFQGIEVRRRAVIYDGRCQVRLGNSVLEALSATP